jgi:hypothetical protein
VSWTRNSADDATSNTAQDSKQWHVDIDHDADDGDHKSASAADLENVA